LFYLPGCLLINNVNNLLLGLEWNIFSRRSNVRVSLEMFDLMSVRLRSHITFVV